MVDGDRSRSLPATTDRRGIPLCGPGLIGLRLEAQVLPSAGRCLAVANDFVLDLDARELVGDEGVVHLRPREFDLLATLAAHPGRALTRRQLVDLAWGSDRRIGLRSVDVHVHWLRSKIEPTPAHPMHLVAIRGFGYRLDPVPR